VHEVSPVLRRLKRVTFNFGLYLQTRRSHLDIPATNGIMPWLGELTIPHLSLAVIGLYGAERFAVLP
jgi:hypothetical protein